MLAGRQTDRQTDRNTPFPYRGGTGGVIITASDPSTDNTNCCTVLLMGLLPTTTATLVSTTANVGPVISRLR